MPIPQILVHSPSITQGWCNVTIECRISWGTEDLKVTWEGKGLPRQLEERVTLGPAPNSWNLAVHLPQSQSYTNITCVVSNEVDQKTATFDLGKVCHLGEAHGECTCHRGGALSEFGCSGMKVLGFSPHRVISTTFQGVTPFRSLGSPSRLHLLLSVSVQALLSTPCPCWSRQQPSSSSPHTHSSFIVVFWKSNQMCPWWLLSVGSDAVTPCGIQGSHTPLPTFLGFTLSCLRGVPECVLLLRAFEHLVMQFPPPSALLPPSFTF